MRRSFVAGQVRTWATVLLVALSASTASSVAACHPTIKSTAPGPIAAAQLAELWVEPDPGRDLRWGVGGQALAPAPAALYKILSIKQGGFSRGYDVAGPDGREWSAKFPPEAGTEIVASRLHWALGYHQPPIYLNERWRAAGVGLPETPQDPARFREKKPALHGLDGKGEWSLYRNPFIGTVQMAGLIVMQVMLGNSDLKDQQTTVYELADEFEGARRWYVLRDLGHTFGRSGLMGAPRGDIDAFEKAGFIKGVRDGRVEFEFRGWHGALTDGITPADVRWLCGRLDKLTDQQWQDAFRAGGYTPALAERFIRRLKQKVADGLTIKD